MYQNDLLISLKSDTFNGLCNDFDDVLNSTLQGMVETERDTAEVNVKVKISMSEGFAPNFSGDGGQRGVKKPKFDHTVSAVIQRKEKKTGTLAGEYELVYDYESGHYVIRPIDNGQIDLFDENGNVIEAEYAEVSALSEGKRALPEGYSVETEENDFDPNEEVWDDEPYDDIEASCKIIGDEPNEYEYISPEYGEDESI